MDIILDCIDIVPTDSAPSIGGRPDESKKSDESKKVEEKVSDNFCKITVNEIIQKKPSLTFILGRSCVGKTTLAKKLAEEGFNIINLDELIKEMGLTDQMKKIYQDEDSSEKVVSKLADKFTNKDKKPCIIEGAIKKMSFIKKIIDKTEVKDYFIVFIMPENEETIQRNARERLESQLKGNLQNPLPIQITVQLAEEYKKNGMDSKLIQAELERFSKETMDISQHRIESLGGGMDSNIYILPSESIEKVGGCGCSETKYTKKYLSEVEATANLERLPDLSLMVESENIAPQISEQSLDISSATERKAKYDEDFNPLETFKMISFPIAPANLERLPDLSLTVESENIAPQISEQSLDISSATESEPTIKKVTFKSEPEEIIEQISDISSAIEKKEKKTKSKSKKVQSKVTIGGIEYDATGYGVYEVQQRKYQAKYDEDFNPLELYEGQVYTGCKDIAHKMIKKSKINELYNKAIGGLAESMSLYEKVLHNVRTSGGDPELETMMILFPISPSEVKNSDIDDREYITTTFSEFVEKLGNDFAAALPKLIGGKKSNEARLYSRPKKLKLKDNKNCVKELLELEKKTIPIIRKLEKRITEDINFIENLSELFKNRSSIISKIGGNERGREQELYD